jgi:Transposase IS116/IS110/IS902 family
VGPITVLAYVLIIGSPERFRCGKQIGSYLGLIPCEDSSAGWQRLGHISKQKGTVPEGCHFRLSQNRTNRMSTTRSLMGMNCGLSWFCCSG